MLSVLLYLAILLEIGDVVLEVSCSLSRHVSYVRLLRHQFL